MKALIVRSPDLISTQSACRGERLRRSRPKSLISSAMPAASHIHKAQRTPTNNRMRGSFRFIQIRDSSQPSIKLRRGNPRMLSGAGMTKLSARCVCRRGFVSRDERVDAPAPRAVEDHKEEEPAIKDGQLTFIYDRKKATRRVDHEIGHRHCAAGDESCRTRKKTKRN